MRDPRDEILPRIEKFLKKHEMSESRLGLMVAKNASLVSRIRKRENLKVESIMQVARFMQEYRPS